MIKAFRTQKTEGDVLEADEIILANAEELGDVAPDMTLGYIDPATGQPIGADAHEDDGESSAGEPDDAINSQEDENIVLPAVVPGSSLSVTSPNMRLTDRLMQDTTVTVKGSRIGRMVSAAVVILSLVGLTAERRWARITPVDFYTIGGIKIVYLAPAVAILAATLVVLFMFYPAKRQMSVRLMADQASEWERVQQEAGTLRWQIIIGSGVLLVGVLFTMVAYDTLPDDRVIAGTVMGAIITLAGLLTSAMGLAKRSALHRLYVQTLGLYQLETMGLGGMADERVKPVLQSLDQLLGALPDAVVKEYMKTDEAKVYLQLVSEMDHE